MTRVTSIPEVDPEPSATARGRWGWRFVDAVAALLFAGFVCLFLSGGNRLFPGLPHRLNPLKFPNLFDTLLGYGAVKAVFDRRWRDALRPLCRPAGLVLYLRFVAGVLALGCSAWLFFHTPVFDQWLCTGNLLPPDRRHLERFLRFFFLAAHLAWVLPWRRPAGLSATGLMAGLRRDGRLGLIAIAGCLASCGFSQRWPSGIEGHQTVWPFCLWVTLWSLMLALKAGQGWPARPHWFRWHVALASTAVAFVAWFSWAGIRKLDLHLGHGDFPVYLQPLYNTLHGHFMWTTWEFSNPKESLCWFGQHLNLNFLALLPIYALSPNPRVFVVLQAALAALAVVPLWRLSRQITGSAALAFAFGWAFLVNPLINRALFFDFHAEVMQLPLVFAAFLSLWNRRTGWFLVWATLLMACKEDAALYVAALGVYAAIFRRQWGLGALGVVWGALWLGVALGWAMPHFRGDQTYAVLASRYPALGGTPSAIVRNLTHHPGVMLHLMFAPGELPDWAYLFLPLAGLPLLHPGALLLIVPPAVELFLSQFRFMKGLSLHYPWFIVPFCFLGALVALNGLQRFAPFRTDAFRRGLVAWLVLGGALFHLYFHPEPPVSTTDLGYFINRAPLGSQFDWGRYTLGARDRRISRFLRDEIPPHAALSAPYRFAHDLSQRAVLRFYPETLGVDLVFVDAYGLGRGDQSASQSKAVLLNLLANTNFGVRVFEDGLLLLDRTHPGQGNLAVAQTIRGTYRAVDGALQNGELCDDPEAIYFHAVHFAPTDAQPSLLDVGAKGVEAGPIAVRLRARAVGVAPAEIVGQLALQVAKGRPLLTRELRVADLSPNRAYSDLILAAMNPTNQALHVVVRYTGRGELWADRVQVLSGASARSDLP